MRFLYIPLLLILLFGCITNPSNMKQNISNKTLDPSLLKNFQYAKLSEKQKLDIYLPKNVKAPYSTIIFIHGGGWRGGTKDACPHLHFQESGYAMVCVGYRLSGEAIFPAQIEDSKAAIRWLRANAQKYNLDTNKFGVFGDSAGGHLSALVGTTGDIKKFDVGENLQYSSEVQAVVDWFGPTTFIRVENVSSNGRYVEYHDAGAQLLGGPIKNNHDNAKEASPITYISANDPPFLIMHGTKDGVVPLSESQELYDALQKAGVDSTLVVLQGAPHGFEDSEYQKVITFFDKHLKN